MTNQQHPITPPFELINQWHKEACKDPYNGGAFIESKVLKYITTAAAQWGADQELDACCEWTHDWYGNGSGEVVGNLRIARRPKPPMLSEQALEDLESLIVDLANHGMGFKTTNIRRSLERLKKLEQLND
jgi:hypothetical protein